jgi:uncharacterized NAD(P)/FAD-binding protein YdhS
MIGRLLAAASLRVADANVEDLAALIGLRERLDDAIVTAVRGLRTQGVTWQDIGDATGTTRQAAIQKWAERTRVNGSAEHAPRA